MSGGVRGAAISPRSQRAEASSRRFSQFVAGQRWWPRARVGRQAAYVFAGDELCTGEETGRASARLYARQTVINCASILMAPAASKKWLPRRLAALRGAFGSLPLAHPQ